MGHSAERDVVEVAAVAGDELRVLGPLDALADGSWGLFDRHVCLPYATGAADPARITEAASRIAATMFW